VDALRALDEDAQRSVGHLEHARDHAADAVLVEVGGPGRLEVGISRGDHRQQAIAAEDVVDQADRALLADGERRQRVGVGHRVAEREDGHLVGQHRAAADLDRAVAVVRRVDVDAGHATGSSTVRMPSV
jgi:hypothetical protein